jgi:UDP-N-acetylmuramoyl-tripeptide--D-alanyl-D-alanine ligase
MMDSTLARAAESMHGVLHGSNVSFRGVSTDTRTIAAGELFVALQGPNFDGSAFVSAAAERQAAAAVIAGQIETTLPNITVTDTRLALGELASSWRQEMSACVVGITGSNGKTTLKELIASCLSQSAETLATHGNLNNDIGLPLMLLRLSPEHRYAVIEMGANHAGEIEYLTSLAEPSVVAITNAGPAHLEGFGSVEGVARAKGEILQSATRPQAAILNADDAHFDYWKSLVNDLRLLSFGLSPEATVHASDISRVDDGSTFRLHMPDDDMMLSLPLQGIHNVRNACAAAAVALALDLSAGQIQRGLESVTPVAGRLRVLDGINGSRVIDDSYNANPTSAIAAIELLAAMQGNSVLVLADMAELGADSAALHRQVGTVAKEAGIERLLATGELSRNTVDAFGDGATWYESADEISTELATSLSPDSNVLVKGSRSMRMGRVVRAISRTRPEAMES